MKLVALVLLIALPAQAQDAGANVIDVHQAVIVEQLVDGGTRPGVVVAGGCWLSSEYCVGYARELADKRARVEYLEAHASDAPYAWMLGALSVGIVVGAVGGECVLNRCFGLRR